MPLFVKILYRSSLYAIMMIARLLPSGHPWYRWLKQRGGMGDQEVLEVEVGKQYILFYCSSVGEFETIKGLIDFMDDRKVSVVSEVVVFSEDAFHSIKARFRHTVRFPLDFPGTVASFFTNRHPDLVVIADNSVWPYFLDHLIDHHIPYLFACLSPSPHSWQRRIYWKLVRGYLRSASFIGAPGEESYNWLKSQDIDHTKITGNPRVASIAGDTVPPGITKPLSIYTKDRLTIICGSTHRQDEELLAEVLDHLPDLRLVIVPHEPSEQRIIEIESRFGIANKFPGEMIYTRQVTIVIEKGWLRHLYRLSPFAYVGGGFERGIHNILEPAYHRCRIAFGPNHLRFPEANDLISMGAARVIRSSGDFDSWLASGKMSKEVVSQLELYFNYHLGSVGRLGAKMETILAEAKEPDRK